MKSYVRLYEAIVAHVYSNLENFSIASDILVSYAAWELANKIQYSVEVENILRKCYGRSNDNTRTIERLLILLKSHIRMLSYVLQSQKMWAPTIFVSFL